MHQEELDSLLALTRSSLDSLGPDRRLRPVPTGNWNRRWLSLADTKTFVRASLLHRQFIHLFHAEHLSPLSDVAERRGSDSRTLQQDGAAL